MSMQALTYPIATSCAGAASVCPLWMATDYLLHSLSADSSRFPNTGISQTLLFQGYHSSGLHSPFHEVTVAYREIPVNPPTLSKG